MALRACLGLCQTQSAKLRPVAKDETKVRVFKLGQEPSDVDYWLSRPPIERIAAVEELRRTYYGEEYDSDPDPEKLSKIVVRKLR